MCSKFNHVSYCIISAGCTGRILPCAMRLFNISRIAEMLPTDQKSGGCSAPPTFFWGVRLIPASDAPVFTIQFCHSPLLA